MADHLRHATADLHIHTALSPCGSDEMTPRAIVEAALAKGLDMIAICDHNSARNVAAVQEAGDGRLAVLAGIEITSAEEVHVVGLFPDATAAEAAGAEIAPGLPDGGSGYTEFFGEQQVFAADGRVLDTETAALAFATSLELDAVVELVKRHGGLAVAAHIDRKAFSVFSQLGVFPSESGFDAVEVTQFTGADSPRMAEFEALGLAMTSSSDSHYLEEIGSAATGLTVKAPSFAELALAFAGAQGRAVGRA
jgi:3',5'-nucleoside bisphosphate phosphatase